MSKARRRRRLSQLCRATFRHNGVVPHNHGAYREAWRRCWYDLNAVRIRSSPAPWRVKARKVWLPVRPRPLPSVHGKIR